MITRSFPKVAAAVAAAVLTACDGGPKAVPAAAPPPPAIHVTTVAVKAQPMPHDLPLTGSLVANQQSDVAANATGRVIKTFVERGDFVKLGQPLVQLDQRTASLSELEARANLESASLQQKLADAQCARNEELFKKGAITKDEWDRVASSCQTSARAAAAAHARADLASQTVSDSTVRAPFPGMVGDRFVSVGEYVQPSTKVATVTELDPLRLQLTVSEADIAAVAPGLTVHFDVAAFPDVPFTGSVKFIGPSVRENTRDLVVEALVDNADKKLRPGMFATAHLVLPDQKLNVVPQTALKSDGTTTRAYVVAANAIEERIVQTGPTRDGMVAILDGLKVGDQVVTQPDDKVRDGIPVN
jgi:membrane fusion protein (multidrug efflux system)